MTDVIIIGAGCAGLTAAIYAQRAGLSTILLEENFYGGQIAISNEIENYPAIPSITGPELAQQIYAQAESLGAQIHFETVTQAELSANPKVVTTHTERYEAKAVIIANGVKRRKLGCPGEEAFTGRGVSYCATCDGAFFRGKDVAIVGGGNTALEDALYLANVCRTVYLVHRRDAFRGEKALADRVRQKENIKIQYDSAVSKIRGESAVSSVLLENTKTGAQQELPVSAVFVAIGLIPENELSKSAGVALNPVTSGPIVNDSLETNIEGIFACGNVLHVHDLVDYVSQEASAAGKNAANYIKNGEEKDAKIVEILPVDGVRYTVPKYIRPTEMDDTLTVRFRVGAVYKNCAIATYFDDQLISKRKRPVMAPGEMEQVILDKKKLGEYPDLSKITIKIEEA